MKTVQETFISIYYEQKGIKPIDRYFSAVTAWEDRFSMKSPFKNFESFRVSLSYHHKK